MRDLRRQKALKGASLSLHLVFIGNPGTGKTTVARLLAQIFRCLGVVSKGHLVETDRSGLVAGFVGQTAIKTAQVVDSAKGGVLFIDEAYALARGKTGGNDFGSEAVETLLKRMENFRADLVVIVAGYTAEMAEFLSSNPGLSSRFARTLHFEDYSPAQLMEIFARFCGEQDYVTTDDAREALLFDIASAHAARDSHFGNARYVRNLFERTIGNFADRVVTVPILDSLVLRTIEYGDVPQRQVSAAGAP